ncbi:MAG: hypothetical protein AAFQ66_04525 [Pseudomonadota bacterium]
MTQYEQKLPADPKANQAVEQTDKAQQTGFADLGQGSKQDTPSIITDWASI